MKQFYSINAPMKSYKGISRFHTDIVFNEFKIQTCDSSTSYFKRQLKTFSV
jgi:hypothetical protein